MDITTEPIKLLPVRECDTCKQNTTGFLTNIASLSPTSIPIGNIREWQNRTDLSCALCKLIAAVLKDASLRFSLAQNDPISLRFVHKRKHTLVALQFIRKLTKRARTGDVDSILIYNAPRSNHLPGLCSYKSIPTKTDSDMCFETIKDWIRECKENHQACRLSYTSPFPTRVLDIQGPDARLVEGLTGRGNYVALSYCWGKNDFLKTERSTLQSHKESIKLQSMPQNFKDAIYVSRALGYKYLWIDSLCIIQGDEQDWLEQSGLMESVYHNADLVIAATCSDHADGKFLAEARSSYREGIISSTLPDAITPTEFAYRLVPPHLCREGPLNKRGWAFQERLRARRYISFGSRELTWSCQTKTHCECDSVEVVHDIRQFRERSLELFLTHTTPEELHAKWRNDIVPFYTQRELTKTSDKLKALAAISDWFEKKLTSSYIAGLWEKDMILDMLWSTKNPDHRERFQGQTRTFHNAPTWSWIACRGFAYYPLPRRSTATRLALLVSSNIPNALPDPFSIPQLGLVVLRGKLAQATLTHDPSAEITKVGGPFTICVPHESGLTSWIVNPDIFPPVYKDRSANAENVHSQKWSPGELQGEPYPVWLLCMAFYHSLCSLYGLILVPSPDQPATYCRIGLVIFDLRKGNYDIEKILNLWNDEQVTII